ncbi:hypothetical protein LMG26411_06463 [Cupriavidus numazuensis]|uniref:Uncharacterized protein n=1 Tax=Cupriavidus numazuensis TaxID=221992 RepID=A0ABM8TS86_9BURK|nr:hypothetical protein LMG26411_06463 [Cupriavidus numazuensis]
MIAMGKYETTASGPVPMHDNGLAIVRHHA